MFAVEVQDAQGRTMPIADNEVQFRVSGQGKGIGVGNGDPTCHESDKGSSRKAFNGFCTAIVQSTKAAGTITVEASSPGLAPGSVTISSRAVKLRPQAPVWEREVPEGPGITGLWRSEPAAAAAGLQAFFSPPSQVFTFRQSGNSLTGSVEGGGAGLAAFFGGGGETPGGHRRGKGGRRRHLLQRRAGGLHGNAERRRDRAHRDRRHEPPGARGAPPAPAGPHPAIGPPPDGSDPSNAAFFGLSRGGGARLSERPRRSSCVARSPRPIHRGADGRRFAPRVHAVVLRVLVFRLSWFFRNAGVIQNLHGGCRAEVCPIAQNPHDFLVRSDFHKLRALPITAAGADDGVAVGEAGAVCVLINRYASGRSSGLSSQTVSFWG